MINTILHICNINTPQKSSFQNVYSKKELDLTKEDNSSTYLINIHLNWNDRKLSSNYGFDIANLIRSQKKSKAPIIFYSPIQQSYFEKLSKKEIKYKILFGRGSGFIEIPSNKSEISKQANGIHQLSDAALHDVVTMLCDLRGIVIDKLNHDLKFESNIDEVVANVTPYLSKQQRQLINLDSFLSEIKARVKEKDRNGFLNEKLKFITLCNQELTPAGKNRPNNKTEKYKVLVIDDFQEEIDDAKSFLKETFTVIEATKAEDAIVILKNDVENEILAVVSDWRLFTDDKQNYWQTFQGYEVLDFAAKSGIRSLFALTSQADFVIHQIRNLMGIRFSLFKKENLHKSDQWQIFIDILFENCKEAVLLIASLPASKNWVKDVNKNGEPITSLKQQYIEVWNSTERNVYFLRIAQRADELWKYFKNSKKNNYRDLKALNNEFGIQLSTTKMDLEPVLILRRIWMALWFNQPDTDKKLPKELLSMRSEKIYEMMFAPGYKGDKSVSANQTAYKLCLEINEVQKRIMLPEEKAWLIENNLL